MTPVAPQVTAQDDPFPLCSALVPGSCHTGGNCGPELKDSGPRPRGHLVSAREGTRPTTNIRESVMSQSNTAAFIKQFQAELAITFQNKGSRLRGTIRTAEGAEGKSVTFRKMGAGRAKTRDRHGKIPPMNLDHSSVECYLHDFYADEWTDALDKLMTNHKKRAAFVEHITQRHGRRADSLIINALNTATTHTQTANLSAMTADTFAEAVTTMGARDVPVGDGQLFGLVSWEVWHKMFSFDQFARTEYIGAKDLPLKGGATTARRWLDVLWMPFSGVSKSGTQSRNLIYHSTAAGHAIGQEIGCDISAEKTGASHVVCCNMRQGACLIDTNGVQQLIIDENA